MDLTLTMTKNVDLENLELLDLFIEQDKLPGCLRLDQLNLWSFWLGADYPPTYPGCRLVTGHPSILPPGNPWLYAASDGQ